MFSVPLKILQQTLAVEEDPMKSPLSCCRVWFQSAVLLPLSEKDRRNWLTDMGRNCLSTQIGATFRTLNSTGRFALSRNYSNQEPFSPSSQGRKGACSSEAFNSGNVPDPKRSKKRCCLSRTLILPSQLPKASCVLCRG